MRRIIANFFLMLILGAALLQIKGVRLLDLGFVERSEQLLYDWRLGYLSEVEYNSDIFIVDVDDASLDKVGRWPWRRDVLADLVQRLIEDHQVQMVAFAFPLSEADVVGGQIMDELKERFRFDTSVQYAIDSIASDYDFDRTLARIFDGRNVLLPYSLTELPGSVGVLPPPSVLFDARRGVPYTREQTRRLTADMRRYDGYIGNLEVFQTAALGAGAISPIVDADGIVRRMPLISSVRGVPYESLPVRVLRHYKTSNPHQLRVATQGDEVTALKMGNKEVSVGSDSTIYLKYFGMGGPRNGVFQYLSAASVLDGIPVGTIDLRGKVAVIGSSSMRLSEIVATPLNPTLPTVELVAQSIANLLTEDALYRPVDAWQYEAFLFFALGLILAVLLPLVGPILALPLAGAIAYAVVYLNIGQWVDNGRVYELFPVITMIILMFVWNLAVGFVIEYRSTRRMQGVLGQYLPPALAKRMSKSKRDLTALRGEEKELSILFSDVRGFTSISEQFDPQALSTFMNQMLTSLSECVHDHEGTIDKYIGDAVMAFWGAPLDDANHALHSVMAALDMQVAIAKLSGNLEKKRLPRLRLGIGVCTGLVRVGNMGSNIRLNYTVMGDSVNTASRLEGITKYYGVPILVSDLTADQAGFNGPVAFREVDTIRVKGKTRPVKIYQPMGIRAKLNSFHLSSIEEFHKVLEMYKSRDFQSCLAKLYTLREQFPNDGLLEVYISRVEDLLRQPLAEDWEPVWNFVTK